MKTPKKKPVASVTEKLVPRLIKDEVVKKSRHKVTTPRKKKDAVKPQKKREYKRKSSVNVHTVAESEYTKLSIPVAKGKDCRKFNLFNLNDTDYVAVYIVGELAGIDAVSTVLKAAWEKSKEEAKQFKDKVPTYHYGLPPANKPFVFKEEKERSPNDFTQAIGTEKTLNALLEKFKETGGIVIGDSVVFDDPLKGSEKKKVHLWRQRSGDYISISEMDVPHIINCIHMLQKQADKHESNAIAGYSYSGGEYAEMAAESDADHSMDQANAARSKIRIFKEELALRNVCQHCIDKL